MCYCDGFGVCMESMAALDAWFKLDQKKKDLEDELRAWEKEHPKSETQTSRTLAREQNYRQEIDGIKAELERLKHEAIARGDDPIQRRKALAS
jgi:septal ring factor EnvC (AmiA/AmiB activator)